MIKFISNSSWSYVRVFALLAFILAILSVGCDWASEYNEFVRETQNKLAREATGSLLLESMVTMAIQGSGNAFYSSF